MFYLIFSAEQTFSENMNPQTNTKTRKGGCLFSLIKLFILCAIVLGVALYFSLGFIGDYAIKTITSGTEITGGIGNIKVKPLDESAEVTDFFITNPAKKYNKETAVAFKHAFVDVDLHIVDILTKNVIVVDEITIDGLEANIEYSANSITSTNLNDISNIIQNKLGISNENKKPTTEVKAENQKESKPMKFIIKKLTFKNGKVSSSVLGNVAETPLPDFDIENIGVEQGGKTIGEIIAYVLPRVATQGTQQLLKGGLKGSIKITDDTAKELKNATKDLSNKIKGLFSK